MTTAQISTPKLLEGIRWDSAGLVPAIVQDKISGRVLMMAWMNGAALQATAEEGNAVFWSRSRQALWRKGETSGHTQRVSSMRLDCDGDTILLTVEQIGGIACHTGRESCFYREWRMSEINPAKSAWEVVDAVVKDPHEIYGDPKV